MRMFTNHYYHHLNAWSKGLTKNVKLLVAFFLLGSFFISENIFAQAGTAPVVAPTAGLKLDGHLQRQTAGIGDWLKGTAPLDGAGTFLFNDDGTIAAPYNGALYNGLIFHKVDRHTSQDDEGFDGGNKLFHNPNNWGWSSKKQLSKDDMNNSLVFITRDANDHIWVLISGDRASENGTSYLDFEFYKTSIAMTGPNQTGAPVVGGKGGFLTAGPHGGRTIGDLSVTLSFTSGGSVAGVSFLQWAPTSESTYDYLPVTPDDGDAYVAANTVITNVPFGAFGLTTYAPNLFIEAAIDVTALIGDGISDQCAGLNFQSLFIKTKSSAERTADLKDFIAPFSISLCGDRTPSVITSGGSPLTLGCNPSASSINAALGSATASDNCSTPTLTSSDGTIQVISCGRSQTRTWTSVDACGNVTTVSRTATWTADLTAPGITATGNNAALGCNPSASAINAALGSATASDGCGNSTLTPADGSVSSNGCSRSKTRTWVARDGCGNTSSTSRTANWTEAGTLTITCPPDRHYQCTDAITSTSTAGVAVANGGCSPVVTFSDQATTKNCSKLIKRTWTATDACGQTVTCTQNILVTDSTPPVIVCNGALATATDNCSSPANILLYLSNGVWTAVDESGNIGTQACPPAGRLAPTQVIEETKPVVTEPEKTGLSNSKSVIIPVQSNQLEVYAYPNPFTDHVNFRFTSPESGTAKIELFDMLGQRVLVINIGTVQAGEVRSVNYKIPALKRTSMIYKLTVGSQTGNGKLISGTKNP